MAVRESVTFPPSAAHFRLVDRCPGATSAPAAARRAGTALTRWGPAVLALATVAHACPGQDPPPKDAPITTIERLWAGFDPRAVPLDVEVVKAWDEGDVHLETVYFTGEVFEGETVRVFGHFGRPEEGRGEGAGRPARPRRRADGRARLAPVLGEARATPA